VTKADDRCRKLGTFDSRPCVGCPWSIEAAVLIRDTAQGREEGEGSWTLSSDGNRYTTVTIWKDREGKTGPANERRFTRNSENCLNTVKTSYSGSASGAPVHPDE